MGRTSFPLNIIILFLYKLCMHVTYSALKPNFIDFKSMFTKLTCDENDHQKFIRWPLTKVRRSDPLPTIYGRKSSMYGRVGTRHNLSH